MVSDCTSNGEQLIGDQDGTLSWCQCSPAPPQKFRCCSIWLPLLPGLASPEAFGSDLLDDGVNVGSRTTEFTLKLFATFCSGRGTLKRLQTIALGFHSLAKHLGFGRTIFLGIGPALNYMFGECFALQCLAEHWITSFQDLGSGLLSKLLQPERTLVCQIEVQQTRVHGP